MAKVISYSLILAFLLSCNNSGKTLPKKSIAIDADKPHAKEDNKYGLTLRQDE